MTIETKKIINLMNLRLCGYYFSAVLEYPINDGKIHVIAVTAINDDNLL